MTNTEQHKQYLVLVDDTDRQWGKMEKMEVHQLGLLHRAFSIFIFNTQGQMLLQQRNDEKYHSGGLWTNTCCSHPQFGEDMNDAVNRRLYEEMGMEADMQFAFSFIYKAHFDNGLTEHEFDHVYMGISDVIPKPDKDEVKSWKYMNMEDIAANLKAQPEQYTHWFRICFEKAVAHYHQLHAVSDGI